MSGTGDHDLVFASNDEDGTFVAHCRCGWASTHATSARAAMRALRDHEASVDGSAL